MRTELANLDHIGRGLEGDHDHGLKKASGLGLVPGVRDHENVPDPGKNLGHAEKVVRVRVHVPGRKDGPDHGNDAASEADLVIVVDLYRNDHVHEKAKANALILLVKKKNVRLVPVVTGNHHHHHELQHVLIVLAVEAYLQYQQNDEIPTHQNEN